MFHKPDRDVQFADFFVDEAGKDGVNVGDSEEVLLRIGGGGSRGGAA